jgi:replicative DNA helicase
MARNADELGPPIDLAEKAAVRGRNVSDNRSLPEAREAEEALLGAMLLNEEAIAAATEIVTAADFRVPAHQMVFDAITTLYATGEPVDVVTVADVLDRHEQLERIGGPARLVALQGAPAAIGSAARYAKIVEERALLRRMITAASEIAEMGYAVPDDVAAALDRAESKIFEVAEKRVTDTTRELGDLLEATLDRLEQMYERKADVTGLASGFKDLDRQLSGFQDSSLIIVGARPAMGKTAFALGLASHAAIHERRPVLFFSLEMSHIELTQRILASEARIDSAHARTGQLTMNDWERINRAVGRLEAPMFIDDNPNVSIMEIRAKARRLKAQQGDLGLVVIDYLQLMTGRSSAESRQVEVAEISRGLKILARELECPVIALSQLSRNLEMRTDKRPMLSDLRESGCLTADTKITRSDTGAQVTMRELLESGERDIPVWSVDEHLKVVPTVMSHVFPSGTKVVYRLRLASGRTIKASGNHPFLKLDGWAPLDDLEPGDHLAVPRQANEAGSDAAASLPPGIGDHLIKAGLPGSHAAVVTRAELAAMNVGTDDPWLHDVATSDVLWDEIVGIDLLGPMPVFDATVPDLHNFVADGIVVHNSLEQDADVVLFLYRNDVYHPEDRENEGIAEVIVAKHRNGPTGTVRLAFHNRFTRFEGMATEPGA